MDAMGTQTAIAQQIIMQKGDYVLALNGHQGDSYLPMLRRLGLRTLTTTIMKKWMQAMANPASCSKLVESRHHRQSRPSK